MQHARESPNSAVFCASGLPVSRYMPSNAQRVAGKHRQPYRCLSLAKFKFMSSPVPQHRTTSSRFQAQNNTPADLITGWRYAVSLLNTPKTSSFAINPRLSYLDPHRIRIDTVGPTCHHRRSALRQSTSHRSPNNCIDYFFRSLVPVHNGTYPRISPDSGAATLGSGAIYALLANFARRYTGPVKVSVSTAR